MQKRTRALLAAIVVGLLVGCAVGLAVGWPFEEPESGTFPDVLGDTVEAARSLQTAVSRHSRRIPQKLPREFDDLFVVPAPPPSAKPAPKPEPVPAQPVAPPPKPAVRTERIKVNLILTGAAGGRRRALVNGRLITVGAKVGEWEARRIETEGVVFGRETQEVHCPVGAETQLTPQP